MKVKYEVMAKAGTYEKAGETKTRWHRCGVVLQGDKGFSLKLESLPIQFDGWLNFFEPKEQTPPPPAKTNKATFDDLNDPPF